MVKTASTTAVTVVAMTMAVVRAMATAMVAVEAMATLMAVMVTATAAVGQWRQQWW
jgi:hypothetical protein